MINSVERIQSTEEIKVKPALLDNELEIIIGDSAFLMGINEARFLELALIDEIKKNIELSCKSKYDADKDVIVITDEVSEVDVEPKKVNDLVTEIRKSGVERYMHIQSMHEGYH